MSQYLENAGVNRIRRSGLWFGVASVAALIGTAATAGETIEFDESLVRIEVNATDGDAGFQGMADGEGWRQVKIFDPDRKQIFDVKAKQSTRRQKLTEIFFESAEPSCEEQPFEDFLARFPASDDPYKFKGWGPKGLKMKGESGLTHDIPYAPMALMVDGVSEPGATVAAPVAAISWEPGSAAANGVPRPDLGTCGTADVAAPAELFGFQLVVEREYPDPLLVFSVDVEFDDGTAVYTVDIPSQVTAAGGLYKYEVVAIELRDGEYRGNHTISENTFCTADDEATCECIVEQLDVEEGDPDTCFVPE
jgi:hypothetical protein